MICLQIPIVFVLLRHFNWNHDRLIEKSLESADRVLQDCGEPDPRELVGEGLMFLPYWASSAH